MELNPKQPPGRTTRKARRYLSEMHRLRAEGHTLESIRLALLDVGVSVSISTVRREVARPPSTWELERAHEGPPAFEDPQQGTGAMSVAAPSPAPLGASSGKSHDPAQGASALGQIVASDDRRSIGLLSKLVGALRRLRRAMGLP
jgi:hypothetical protein